MASPGIDPDVKDPLGSNLAAENPLGIDHLAENPLGIDLLAENPLGIDPLVENHLVDVLVGSNPADGRRAGSDLEESKRRCGEDQHRCLLRTILGCSDRLAGN